MVKHEIIIHWGQEDEAFITVANILTPHPTTPEKVLPIFPPAEFASPTIPLLGRAATSHFVTSQTRPAR